MIRRIGEKEATLAEKPCLSESQDRLEELQNKSWFSPPCALCPHPCSLRKDKARWGFWEDLSPVAHSVPVCVQCIRLSWIFPFFFSCQWSKLAINTCLMFLFQHEASHDACRINTGGLRVKLRQFTWVCGNIYFTKLTSTLWQAGVSTDGKRAFLSTLEHRWPVVGPVPCNQLGLVLRKCKLLSFFLHHLYFWTYINVMNSLPLLMHCNSTAQFRLSRCGCGHILDFDVNLKLPLPFWEYQCGVFRRCVCNSKQLLHVCWSDVCL